MLITTNKLFKEQKIDALRDTEVYTVSDIGFLDNLTVSETVLHATKQTLGHSHDDLDEVYFFISGKGCINYGEEYRPVEKGTVVLIKGGLFHKVFNTSETEDLVFISVFQKYERS